MGCSLILRGWVAVSHIEKVTIRFFYSDLTSTLSVQAVMKKLKAWAFSCSVCAILIVPGGLKIQSLKREQSVVF